MLLKFFKGTGPGVIFLLIITFGLLWISAFLNPQLPGTNIYETRPMPLYSVVKFLIGSKPLPGVIFSFATLSIMLFLLVNFNTSVFFINERTFLPAVIYVIFSALFPENQVLNPVLPATLFLMLSFRRIMDSYRKPGIAFNFFDASVLISLGSLFYANLIWFGLLVLIGIALLRPGNITEISSALIGLVTPYILIFGLYYVLGKDLGVLLGDIRGNLFGDSQGYSFQRLTIIVLIYSGLMILISTGYLLQGINSKKIKSRKTFYLLLWGFFLSLAVYFILPSVSVELVWITAIPVSYLLANYFVFVKKKIIPEIIFSGFCLLVLPIQLLYIF
jgi:hypothetical protein